MPKPKLIHIGKCGGTFVQTRYGLNEYHMKRNYSKNDTFVIWIRNPIARFVSAFWFSHVLINMDIADLKGKNLNLNNCIAPNRIRYKMNHDHTFSKDYDMMINHFGNPNALAEALSSNCNRERMLAQKLCSHSEEHINKGIGWYLHNGSFVEKNVDKILFVGRLEHMSEDIGNLDNIISSVNKKSSTRQNETAHDKYLSKLAIQNIIQLYTDTDYKALKVLLCHNLISREYYDFCYTYKS